MRRARDRGAHSGTITSAADDVHGSRMASLCLILATIALAMREGPSRSTPNTIDAARILRLAPFAILALGALLRALQLLELPSFPAFFRPETDAYYYRQYAQRIAQGDLLLSGTPPRMSPGYTWFLGLVYALFGAGPWAPPLIQMLLGLCTVGMIMATARRYAGERWALVSGLLAAAYGPFVYFESHLLAASLGVFATALWLWASSALHFGAAPTRLRLLSIGAACGLCSIVRPNALLLFGALALLALQIGERRPAKVGARLALIAVGGALVIGPLTLRNLAVTGEPIALTSHGGINFYIGNSPSATGTWMAPPEVRGATSVTNQFEEFHRAAEHAVGRALGPGDADAYWYRRTLEAVYAHPFAWLSNMLRKLHLFWNGRELHNIYDYEFWRDIGVVLGLPLPQFSWIAPFGLLALVWLPFRSPPERFLAAAIACLCAGVVIVYVTDRYRLPVAVPVLVALAPVGRALAERAKNLLKLQVIRRRLALAWPFVALGLAGLVAVPVAVNKRYHEKYAHLGDEWLELGRLDYAQWAYEHAAAANPGYLPAQQKLAEVYLRLGRPEPARDRLRKVLAIARTRHDGASVRRAERELEAIEALRTQRRPSPRD